VLDAIDPDSPQRSHVASEATKSVIVKRSIDVLIVSEQAMTRSSGWEAIL
jgi:hypothetical protein